MIIGSMIIIIIHLLFNIDHSMKKQYFTFAKCIVVNQQRKQQIEFENKTIQSTNEAITNENMIWITTTTTTIPCDNCNSDQLHQQYNDHYLIVATLNAEDRDVIKNIVDEQKQWRKIIIEAMEVQRTKHYKQPFNKPIFQDNNNQTVDVKILETQCSTRTCVQTFVVLYNDEPIPAEIIVSDLSLLSLPRISARLGIPVESITTLIPTSTDKSQWWIIAVVIGVAISIIAAGWLCLFVYYNSCGRPYTVTTAKKPFINKIFLKDKFIQTAGNDNEGKDFDVQSRENIENSRRKSLTTIPIETGAAVRRMEKAVDSFVKDVVSEEAIATTTPTLNKEYANIDQQPFDYPISIITRPRRRDLHIHKLESSVDISMPTLKKISVDIQEKMHPHPIPPTVSGILEVRSISEQMCSNPMNCL